MIQIRSLCPVILAAFASILPSRATWAQDNPVYVDDSPQAWEIFRQAQDQSRDNAGEAVRLYQELLDEFGLKLVPALAESDSVFVATRRRVLDELLRSPELLERYRAIETPQAAQLLAEGELMRLASTRPLTEPGLTALMRLAQKELEEGRFLAALAWLDQAAAHPDLDSERAAFLWHMVGVASHYRGDRTRLDTCIQSLSGAGMVGQPFLEHLQKLMATPMTSSTVVGQTPLDAAAPTGLGDLVSQAIWTSPMQQSLLHRRFSNPVGGLEEPQNAAFDQHQNSGDLTTAAPTVAGMSVFINEGYRVRSLNRLTGREQWAAPYDEAPRLAVLDRDDDHALDLNMIAVRGSSLVTLTGHAYAGALNNPRKIVCLNTETGEVCWPTPATLESVGTVEGDEQLFPHGAPIIGEGMVYVMARKVSRQLLTSAYVVALDLETGKVRWAQYITSSGGLRPAPRPVCSLVADRDGLYVASAVGAAARLDPVTGEIRWLRRFDVPVAASLQDAERRPWEFTGPALTERGILVIQPDGRRIVLLDKQTGEERDSHSIVAENWDAPRYLLANEDLVFAVGSAIMAFRADAIGTPLWRLPAIPVADGVPDPNMPQSLDIRGRVQLSADGLIVPTAEGVYVIDTETGRAKQLLPVQTVGNALATEAQLVVAGSDRLDSYMSFAKAEAMLRERIAQAPADPEPPLSLLRLSLRVRALPLAIESAELAMKAINGLAPGKAERLARAELFSLLLEVGRQKVPTTRSEGEQLFALVGAVAIDPTQRVEYLLTYGDWLAGQSAARAIETYQSLLIDPVLARTHMKEGDVVRHAAMAAVDRMNLLIAQNGPDVYSAQADFARMQLETLKLAPVADAKALQRLIEEYPLSDAAREAALLSADASAARGDFRRGLSALIAAYRASPWKERASSLLGRAVEVCIDAGWMTQAGAILEQVQRSHPGETLQSKVGPKDAAAWLTEIGLDKSTRRGANIGEQQGVSETVPGRLVPAHPLADDPRHPDAALMLDGHELRLYASPTMESAWSTVIDGDSPQVLSMNRTSALLWFGADSADQRAALYDLKDGSLRWTTPRLADLVGDPVKDLQRGAAIREPMPDGEAFDPQQSLPLVGPRHIIIVQRIGPAIAFDRTDGRTVLWKTNNTLEQVHLAQLRDYGLVLAGLKRQVEVARPEPNQEAGAAPAGGVAALVPAILVLDPQSGALIHEFNPVGRAGVKWMTVDPLGLLTYGSSDGVECIDLLSGRAIWTNTSFALMDTLRAWSGPGHIILEDRANRLRSIQLANGVPTDPFGSPARGDWDPLDLRDVIIEDQQAIARYRQRVMMYAFTGEVRGADVVADDRDYRFLLPGKGTYVLISGRTEQAPAGNPGFRRTQFVYRIYRLSDNGQLLGEFFELAEPLPERLQDAQLIDGWLLVSTQSGTVAIPMPASQ